MGTRSLAAALSRIQFGREVLFSFPAKVSGTPQVDDLLTRAHKASISSVELGRSLTGQGARGIQVLAGALAVLAQAAAARTTARGRRREREKEGGGRVEGGEAGYRTRARICVR